MSSTQDVNETYCSDLYVPNHQNGPDYIIPTENIRTWKADGATKIISNKYYDELWKPESVYSLLRTTVNTFPNRTALTIKRNDEWIKWTYSEFWKQIQTVAKGFIKLGLVPFHGVGILSFNSPEWTISHFAAMFAGGLPAGIYVTNSADACFDVLEDCKANIVVVDNQFQLNKILKIRNKLPHLKAIINYGDESKPEINVYSWVNLLNIGESMQDSVLDARVKGLAINQCCCLIYTSGTTGKSKGAMATHDNFTFHVNQYRKTLKEMDKGEKSAWLSYLPLSHIAALLADVYNPIGFGGAVYYAPPSALKGTLLETVMEVKPTFILLVPRVAEKIYLKLTSINALALESEKVKTIIGFENMAIALVGSAPASLEMLNYFNDLKIPIVEAYGLSECAAAHIHTTLDNPEVGTVGNINTFAPKEAKIKNPDENGCGELLIKGRNVFMGYLNLEKETQATIDDDQWMSTGDLATIDASGNIRITGRIKELIITSGGENVSSVYVENKVKNLLPIISNCVLIGDKRHFITILITLQSEINANTMLPLDKLSPETLKWYESVGSRAATVSEAASDNAVLRGIQKAIDVYNAHYAISTAQYIQKFIILAQDFSIPTGEIGPTSKLKKSFIVEKYADKINEMYK